MATPAVSPGAPPSAREQATWTDDALLAAFLASGDQGAFAEIVARHGAMVFRACLRRLGNVHDAEDAAQAAFVELARTPARARGMLGGWLHKVACHMALTLVRTRARRAHREEEAAMRKRVSQPPTEDAFREELDNGIAGLPPRLREAVILCYLEGHKQADAARILGCNQSTLSRWAADGLERLRAFLGRRGVTVTSVALVGFFAQQNATAAVPAGLFASLGLAAAGKAAVGGLSVQAAALVDAAGKAALVAKAKLAAAVLVGATVIVAGTTVMLRPAEPVAPMMLLDFDGATLPVNQAGDGYPKPIYDPGRSGGKFVASIEPVDAVKGHSLRLRLTAGMLKAHFAPAKRDGSTGFARDYAVDPAHWRFNTYNRMRFWIKLPASSPVRPGDGANMFMQNFVKRVRDADEHSLADAFFIHRFNVPVTGQWTQVIINMHPCAAQNERSNPGNLPHPTDEPDYNYFDALTAFTILAIPAPAKYPADYLLDEIEFYREPGTENDDQVYSITAAHVPSQGRIVATWNHRPDEAVAHEVRYAFEDIHRLGWKRAPAAPGGTVRPGQQANKDGMIYDTQALPLAGHSVLYLAIKPQNSDVFSQVAIPLDLKH